MKTFQDFLHIMDFNGNKMVQGPKDSFQTMNKGLIKWNDCSFFAQFFIYI